MLRSMMKASNIPPLDQLIFLFDFGIHRTLYRIINCISKSNPKNTLGSKFDLKFFYLSFRSVHIVLLLFNFIGQWWWWHQWRQFNSKKWNWLCWCWCHSKIWASFCQGSRELCWRWMLLASNTTSSNQGNSDIFSNFSIFHHQKCILNRLVMTTIISTISMEIICQLKVT